MTDQDKSREQRIAELESLRQRVAELEASLGSPDDGNGPSDSRQHSSGRQRVDAESLRESEEKFRLAFSNANTGMCLVDLQGRLLQVNDKMTEIFGYSRPELEGMTVEELALPEDVGLSRAFIDQAVQRKKTSETFEKRYRHRQGHVIYGLVASSLVRDAQGRPRYFISQVQDISQRKQAERELNRLNAELEQRVRQRTAELTKANTELQAIYDGMLDGVAIVDIETQGFLRVNAALCRMLGYSEQEFASLSVPNLHPPDRWPQIANAFHAHVEGQATRSEDIPLMRKDGTVLHADLISSRIVYQERPSLITFARDVTERRRAEHALRQAKEAAEAANRAKSEFLANVSHEIRTPMTSILGFSELLQRPDLPADQRRRYLEVLQRNGQTLLQLLDDILDLSKIEAGRLAVERLACAPWQVVDEVLDLLRVRAEEKRLSLEAEYRWPLPATFRTDPVRLRQILVNLVGNAIKFTESGGVRIEVFHAPGPPAQLCFAVADTGIGIEPAVLKHLFQPFVQADTSHTRRFGGSGLGLAICQRLAALLGGRIRVSSRPGQGSTFTLALELDPADPAALAETGPVAPRELLETLGRDLPAADGPDRQIPGQDAPCTDPAACARLQACCLTTLQNLLPQLQQARQDDDRERLATSVRTLAAAAKVFGIADLEKCAEEITRQLHSGARTADLAEPLQTLLDICQQPPANVAASAPR